MSGLCIDWFLVVGADWISQASMLISYLGKTDRFPVVRQPTERHPLSNESLLKDATLKNDANLSVDSGKKER